MSLPLSLLLLGWAMALSVVWLAWVFWRDSDAGMALATHRTEQLPRVMVNRYFVIFMFMGGALASRNPLWVAYAFAVTAIASLWDALIYRKAGQPFRKHLVAALSSALVAGWAGYVYQASEVTA